MGLCYSCGRLGHEMKACTHKRPSDNTTTNTVTPYREWLKAGVRWRMEEPSQGGGSTQSRASLQEENPSKPSTTTVTNLATPAENAIPKLNCNKNGKDGVKRAMDTQLMGADQFQKSDIEYTNKVTGDYEEYNPMNLTQDQVEKEDMHGKVDMALEMEFGHNSHKSPHVTSMSLNYTNQPKWTRIVRQQNYDNSDIHGKPKATVGQKREHADCGLATKPDETKDGKQIKTGVDLPYPTISTVEAAL